MAKDSRKYGVAACTMILLIISFWVSIVSSILCRIDIPLIASIVYMVCIIMFEHMIYEGEENWKKRVLRFVASESLQLVPCAIILVVRGLL